MVTFFGPKCGERLEFSENMGGQSIPCPRCRESVAVPSPSPGIPAAHTVPGTTPYPAIGNLSVVGSLDSPLAAAILFNLAGVVAGFFDPGHGSRNRDAASAYLVIMVMIVVPAIASWCVIVYRWWSCLPPGWRQTTPEKAVGLSFVPFFCFYWWFIAYGGLAADLNRYMDAHGIRAERVSVGLAHAYVTISIVGLLLCWVPIVTGVIGLVGLVLFSVFGVSATRACKSIVAARLALNTASQP